MKTQMDHRSDIQHPPAQSLAPQSIGAQTAGTRSSWKHRVPFLNRPAPAAGSPPRGAALHAALAVLTRIALEFANEGRQAFSVSRQLARQAKTLLDHLRNQTSAIDHLGRLAEETGKSAQEAREHIAEANTLVRDCVEIATSRTDLIKDLLQNVRQSETNFAALNTRVEDVESFVATIQQIGNRTSLLALNAAIEASRAGVHGSGFNVVAREMRLLADRTEAATKEILTITERIRQSSAATSASMHDATGWSRNYEGLGLRAVDNLERCSTFLGQADECVSKASQGAEAQGAVVETLREDMRVLYKEARQCAYGVDAAAERTMYAVSRAVDLNQGLGNLASTLPFDSQHEQVAFLEQQTDLRQAAAACSEEVGLDEMNRIRPHILRSLEELLATCTSQGPASRHPSTNNESLVPDLCFGGRCVSSNLEQIDSLSRAHGVRMSLLVLSQEAHPRFYRVATSVRLDNGQRALGSQLNPEATAVHKLLRGESTYGYVYLLGMPHLAASHPIFDSAGQVIGAVAAATAVQHGLPSTITNSNAFANQQD